MQKDKVAARAAYNAMSRKDKIDHIWYYYKWHILTTLAALLVSVFVIHSCVTRVNPDLTVIYLSRTFVSDEAASWLEEHFSEHIQDANNDGRLVVSVNLMTFDPEFPTELNSALMQSFEGELAVGNVKLFIADEYFMERLNQRSDGIVARYAEITNLPQEFDVLMPLFVAERIEYPRQLRGWQGERHAIEHENARTIFELLTE